MKTTFPLQEVLQYYLTKAKVYEKKVVFENYKVGDKNI